MSEPIVEPESVCLNCGRPLNGQFCAHCGQQDKEVRRPFIYIFQEILRVVFELDGRAYRTLFFLLIKPGFLTREYFGGRRMSYTPPLRLFLIISIGFFLLVGVVASLQSMQASLLGEEDTGAVITFSDGGLNISTNPDAAEDEVDGEDAGEDEIEEIREFFSNLRLPFLSEETNRNLNRVIIAQVETNLEELREDPQEFLLGSLEYITFFMLLMMPILALIQRILFVFSRHYYVEHLVLTLHNHAFLIFAVFLVMLCGLVTDLQAPYLSASFDHISSLLTFWIVIYLFLSLKFYFGRGYLLSAFLFLTISFIYLIVLSLGLAVFGILLFILA